MKKDNVRIKSNISLSDKANAIEGIVSSYFTDGEYTPYYSEMAETIAIVRYFIEGVEFEDGENAFDAITSDEELLTMIHMIDHDVMGFVRTKVSDKVDFIKKQIIHSHDDTNKIIEACNVIIDSLDNFSKLNLSQMSKEDLETGMKVMRQLADKNFTADDLSKALKDAVGFNMDKATAEIIDSKNAEIRELKKYKVLWEGRNVQNSDKVVTMPTKV